MCSKYRLYKVDLFQLNYESFFNHILIVWGGLLIANNLIHKIIITIKAFYKFTHCIEDKIADSAGMKGLVST